MSYDIDKANYADLKTLEDRVRRTLFAHGFNEKTSTPLGDMNSLCRSLVQDAAKTDAELAALRARVAELEALLGECKRDYEAVANMLGDGFSRGVLTGKARIIEAALRGEEKSQ